MISQYAPATRSSQRLILRLQNRVRGSNNFQNGVLVCIYLNCLADLDDDACFQGSTRVKFEPRNNS